MCNKNILIHKFGNGLADSFYVLVLVSIGVTIVWSAIHGYIVMTNAEYSNKEPH